MNENTVAASHADENVVSAREKVVNALDQGAANTRLKRLSQKVEQFVFVVSAESELRPILKKY